jgi:hypothetical protein
MRMVRQRAQFDWLIEFGGASALSLGGAYAALKLGPSFALPPPAASFAAGFTLFALGFLAMRVAPGPPATHPLANFAIVPLENGELLLDKPVDEPLLLDTPIEIGELLLDAPLKDWAGEDVLLLEVALPEPGPDSRVVRLFTLPAAPTPGELKGDRHLATDLSSKARTRPASPPDASDALYAALDELKRSLR